jgi:uncharacterized membrane protein
MAEIILVVIVALFIVFVWGLWKMKQEEKAGFAVKDERTKKIEGKAARITVHGTGFFILALMWYVFVNDVFELGLPVIETTMALIISVLFNSGLYIGLIFYFMTKED